MVSQRTTADRPPKKKRRVCPVGLKVSHYALGLFGANPLWKKPRREGKNVHGHFGIDKRNTRNLERHNDKSTRGQAAPSLLPKHHEANSKADSGAKSSYLRPWTNGNSGKIISKAQAKQKSFLEKIQLRLSGGQFRMLNEKLYTCSGEEACKIFEEDPTAFHFYHAGYQEQTNRWPRQPVEAIIDWLRARSTALVVADFGCGDGRLAKSVENQVFSLDLVASDTAIIAGNMAHTPLRTSSVDVAVFCLSLMGTDYPSFLVEAHRVLKSRGWLLIAEVKSRFDSKNGGANPEHFIEALGTLGFSLTSKDFSNKMFVMFEFLKQSNKALKFSHCKWPTLKPCIYKRR